MSNNILDRLEEFAREDPHDPFNLYALALAYLKTDSLKGQRLFEQLVIEHSTYVPTYYQLGHVYAAQGKIELAVQTFERGIVAARNAGDHKAMREMEAAKLDVLYDN
jgi:tetratricopeptide (TPR) repeat protein